MGNFQYLLEPRSIAVVGVSDDTGRPSSQAVAALTRYGYRGKIFPVNPKYREFQGLKCYPSIADIDADIDLAIIAVPAQGVLAVMETCAANKIPFVVILSGGFRENGPEGADRERRMLAIARDSGMRILGPNCLGFANIHSNVYAAFGSITREPKLQPGSVSMVTQSGGFGYSIAIACAEAGIGFRHVIATGNESDIDTVELIDALLDDAETHSIVAYVEGNRDGRALMDVGRRALALGKPLLFWKGGVTEQGARAAASHTASLTASYDFYRALFKQTGMVEIREIHEVVDYLKALEARKYPAGGAVAVMGVSGGSAIVFADAGEPLGLHLCELGEETQQLLAQVVPSIGAIHNPIDLTAGYFSAPNREKLESALKAVLWDSRVDAVCVNLATTGKGGSLVAAEVLGRIAATCAKPLLVFSSAPISEIAEALRVFSEARIPVFRSPGRAAKALAMLVRFGKDLRDAGRPAASPMSPRETVAPAGGLRAMSGTAGSLSEADSKTVLAAAGIPVTKDVLVAGVDGGDIFQEMTPPLVVKIVSRDIAHKTEIGGVRIGVGTRSELDDAIGEVLANARKHAPDAHIEGVLVSEMVRGGFELIAGVVNDAVFGPVVVVGAGGIYTEVLRDSACRLAPFDEGTAREMLDELKCRPMLDGVRGSAPLDVSAVAKALCALSWFAWENRGQIREIDVNPLFAMPRGVVAADALVVLQAS